ncbi:MAG: hypothetical protein ACRDFW_10100 [bacterium]
MMYFVKYKEVTVKGSIPWPMAQIILGDLQDLGIHMLDPTPSNICFR